MPMQEALKPILEIQEYDIKMIRLMRIKKQRLAELNQLESLKKDLRVQMEEKIRTVESLKQEIHAFEGRISELQAKVKKLESQQASVKKVDEFNAITQEMSSTERERISTEQKLSDLIDRRVTEEEIVEKLKANLVEAEESGKAVEAEIYQAVSQINEEGRSLQEERQKVAAHAAPELLNIYERLLKNKKDRVAVPIENRTCSGCHITLTAQHENLVRKGENLVFCEHCSRIHYWQDLMEAEPTATGGAAKRRRRKAAAV